MLKKLLCAGVFVASLAALSNANAASAVDFFNANLVCTTTPSVLVNSEPGVIRTVIILQTGTTQFYIGKPFYIVNGVPTAISSTTGFPFPITQFGSMTISFQGEIDCVTSSGSDAVSVLAIK